MGSDEVTTFNNLQSFEFFVGLSTYFSAYLETEGTTSLHWRNLPRINGRSSDEDHELDRFWDSDSHNSREEFVAVVVPNTRPKYPLLSYHIFSNDPIVKLGFAFPTQRSSE